MILNSQRPPKVSADSSSVSPQEMSIISDNINKHSFSHFSHV